MLHGILVFALGILEFPTMSSSDLTFFVILGLDPRISTVSSPDLTSGSHQIAVIAEIPSLRGVSETNDEAISFKIPSKSPCVIAKEQSDRSNLTNKSKIP